MRRATTVLCAVLLANLLLASLSLILRADEATKKTEAVKPPWERELSGEDAKKVAELSKRVDELWSSSKFVEAVEPAKEIYTIRKQILGAEHWETVNAEKALHTCKRIASQPAKDQADFVSSIRLGQKGAEAHERGRYNEAEKLHREDLAIKLRILGKGDPLTGIAYHNLAASLQMQGKYAAAENPVRQALAIFEKSWGEAHPETGRVYNDLAIVLNSLGRYGEAEKFYLKALSVVIKGLGDASHLTSVCYNNVGFNLNSQHRYAEALSLFKKALVIQRKELGDDNAKLGTVYGNIAFTLMMQGKYVEAEPFYEKALNLDIKELGDKSPGIVSTYNNLATNLSKRAKYEAADRYLRKALSISSKTVGEMHPETAPQYLALAINLAKQGKHNESKPLLEKALDICKKQVPEEHPLTARTYNAIALCLNLQGNYPEAEEWFRKGLAVRRNVLGEENLLTAGSYNSLAANLHAQGKDKEAETLLRRAADSFAKARLYIAATGLERAALTSEESPLPPLAAVLAHNGKPEDAWQRFEESLARGIWDDLTARLRRPQAERDKQAQITGRIDRLNELIERTSLVKTTKESSKQRNELLSQLRRSYDELTGFTQQLEKQYGPITGQVFSRNQIQAALLPDIALLGWLDIAGHPKAADPNGEHWAILLRSSGDPIWVRMKGSGDSNAWTNADTRLPGQLRAALLDDRGVWLPLAERLRKQRFDPLAEHLKGVRRLIVLPSTALAGVPIEVIVDGYTVSYAHSGTMYAHLRQPTPIGKGLFVLADPVFDPPSIAEQPQPLPPSGVLLTFVAPNSNAADAGLRRNDVLLRYGDKELSGPKDFKPQPESNDADKRVPVIVWREGKTLSRPLFVRPGELGAVIAEEPAPQAVAERRRLNRLLASRSGDDDKWDRLPGTRIEAASLQRLFDKDPVQPLLDSDANEERLNELAKSGELGKYRYIHLATHGEVNDSFPLRSAVILSRDHLPDYKQRTDLLVAGQPIPDGRLEAEEALQRWNLHCDLVTLSACETALGKYERGEGFVGFAQSLILCGTRSVCLSLWKVSDTATALLMERFYQNLLGKRDGLKGPMPKAAALAEAKEWLRNLSREEAVKHAASLSNGVDRGKRPAYPPLKITPEPAPVAADKSARPFAHPYYWAAFVLVGHAD